jgi:hypothetical protein
MPFSFFMDLLALVVVLLWVFFGRHLLIEIVEEKQRRARRPLGATIGKWPTHPGDFAFDTAIGVAILSVASYSSLHMDSVFVDSLGVPERIVAILVLVGVGAILILRGVYSSFGLPYEGPEEPDGTDQSP